LDKPDFAKYSESQLRQVLSRIDRERFPDRVEEIQVRLARLQAERLARPDTEPSGQNDGPPQIAGFWRRSAAFLIDALIIGIVGFILGRFLQDQFEAMGQWGRLVGFVITLAYFGIMESRVFQGCTFGKLAMDIQVVTTAGVPLGIRKALLRSTVFWIPYFLNNLYLGKAASNLVLSAIDALLVFGLGGAIVYLYLFNRRTRQSLHDLLVGVIVVRARRSAAPAMLPVWRGHMAVVVVLFVLLIGFVGYGPSLLGKGLLQSLAQVQQQVSRLPGVRSAAIVEGTNIVSGGASTHVVAIKVVTTGPVDDENLARTIADIALAVDPSARQADTLSVTLARGYDIGIASKWVAKTFNAPLAELRGEQAQKN
jgi:uncharacterized RDD family membrane protein YckC